MVNRFVLKLNGKIKTGGPLAMLQLGEKLVYHGAEVILCFDDLEAKSIFSDWADKFCKNCEKVTNNELSNYSKANLVVTETDLTFLKHTVWDGKVICYMLSVDNCVAFGLKRLTLEASLRHLKNIIRYALKSNHDSWTVLSNKVDLFISQSHYAMSVLDKSTVKPVFFIGDYIEQEKITVDIHSERFSRDGNRLNVCFNPKKGKLYSLMARFMSRNVNFIPIQGLSPMELVHLFKEVDAYIDFGAQPGKDRLPREATACGCPSFIMHSGAGLNNSDFPRAKYFRLKAYQLFMLKKVINQGLDYLEDNLIAERARYAEVQVEEAEFSVRVKQFINIIGS